MAALNHKTTRTTIPNSQFFVRIAHGCPLQVKKVANCWRKFATRIPMKTRETGPGHQATNPAKNPQNGPRTLCVQTYRDPSSGNMRPSCAVRNPPVIRNVANARIQKKNTDGPAACTPAALLMNRTIATKITTRSNGPSVLATRTGATFSEIIACSSARVAIGPPFSAEGARGAGGPPPAHDPVIVASQETSVQWPLVASREGPSGPVSGPGLDQPPMDARVDVAGRQEPLRGFHHEGVVRVAHVR